MTTPVEEIRALWRDGNWDRLAPILRPYIKTAARPYAHGDLDLLEDFVQEALVKCWRTSDVPDRPYGFARAVTRCIGMEYARNIRRQTINGKAAETIISQTEASEHFDERVSVQESFTRALRQLDEHDRIVLALAIRDGRSTAECAAVMETTTSTVVQRLHRARMNLRAVWQLPSELLAGRHAGRRSATNTNPTINVGREPRRRVSPNRTPHTLTA